MESYLRSGKPGKLRAVVTNEKHEIIDVRHVAPGAKQETEELENLSPEQLEDELRLFDLNPAWGPFVGIDRISRWYRASRLDLGPPQRVLDILQMQPRKVELQREGGNLW